MFVYELAGNNSRTSDYIKYVPFDQNRYTKYIILITHYIITIKPRFLALVKKKLNRYLAELFLNHDVKKRNL
jgi:hypothetical protein